MLNYNGFIFTQSLSLSNILMSILYQQSYNICLKHNIPVFKSKSLYKYLSCFCVIIYYMLIIFEHTFLSTNQQQICRSWRISPNISDISSWQWCDVYVRWSELYWVNCWHQRVLPTSKAMKKLGWTVMCSLVMWRDV